MAERRQYQRFALSEPQWGTLEVLEHVDVESVNGREFVVTTRVAATAGEEITLHLAEGTETEVIRARVAESRLHIVNGEVRHRIRLTRVDETAPGSGAMGAAK